MTTFSSSQSIACQIHPEKDTSAVFLSQIRHHLKQYAVFNFLFICLGVVEVLLCLIFFNLITKPHLLAISLATFLMTLFSYFILRTYFQTKKPQNLLKLCEEVLEKISNLSPKGEPVFEKKLFIASQLTRLSSLLKDREYQFYKPPRGLESLRQSFEKLGCWLHWRDFHQVKEWLFFQIIDQYISLIKKQPENLELHVALANTYVLFSRIYATPAVLDTDEEGRWSPPEKFSDKMKSKFKECAQRAIEEFKILNDYNPEDPWVYTQLAYSYHDLQMPQEEIKAYETIAKLSPNDYDNLHKLGTLYFQQGLTAKGLKVYETLKEIFPQKAQSLIKHYGHYSSTID